jgi:DNA-binding transcriptional ArsR family regulator
MVGAARGAPRGRRGHAHVGCPSNPPGQPPRASASRPSSRRARSPPAGHTPRASRPARATRCWSYSRSPPRASTHACGGRDRTGRGRVAGRAEGDVRGRAQPRLGVPPRDPSRPPVAAARDLVVAMNREGGDDELWAAVADPSRHRVLDVIVARGEVTPTALARELPFTRQAVSKHLAVLQRTGLVAARRQGREVATWSAPSAWTPRRARWPASPRDGTRGWKRSSASQNRRTAKRRPGPRQNGGEVPGSTRVTLR